MRVVSHMLPAWLHHLQSRLATFAYIIQPSDDVISTKVTLSPGLELSIVSRAYTLVSVLVEAGSAKTQLMPTLVAISHKRELST